MEHIILFGHKLLNFGTASVILINVEVRQMDRFANYYDISILDTRLVAEAFMSRRQFTRPNGRQYAGLVLVIDGSAEYHFESHSSKAEKGDLIFLAQSSAAYYFDIESEMYHYLYIDFLISKKDASQQKSHVIKYDNEKMMRFLFEKILNVWIRRKSNFLLECKSLLYQIFSQITIDAEEEKTKTEQMDKIKNSIEYLLENYTEKGTSISHAASISNLSEVHFRRVFKEIVSMPPIKYLNMLRIEKAKELLKNTSISVSDIVDAVGYSNVNYFCKRFKKETGLTPSQYRKNNFQ